MESFVDIHPKMVKKTHFDEDVGRLIVHEETNKQEGFLDIPDEIKIIIIEDEWEYSDSIRDTLEDEGYTVKESVEAGEALDMMKTRVFDVALIDIILPDMSGIKLLERIKIISPDTIPIMMTAFASVETAIEALRLGAIAYLYKPVNMDELLIYIKKAYNRRKAKKNCKRRSAILENQKTAVIVTSRDGTITYCNKHSQKIFLYTPNELPGKNIKILFPGEKKEIPDIGVMANSLLKDNDGLVYPFDKREKQVRCYMSVSRLKAEQGNDTEYIWTFMKPERGMDKTV